MDCWYCVLYPVCNSWTWENKPVCIVDSYTDTLLYFQPSGPCILTYIFTLMWVFVCVWTSICLSFAGEQHSEISVQEGDRSCWSVVVVDLPVICLTCVARAYDLLTPGSQTPVDQRQHFDVWGLVFLQQVSLGDVVKLQVQVVESHRGMFLDPFCFCSI